ncbi:MAG TPA: bifunctional diguanylate cyclase/phosphodiesterase [Acidimicrobiales bacterium]|nr:bifunctional diguanylate cyclase/phosphodiesterase [Acidimicrobiales bacterium]
MWAAPQRYTWRGWEPAADDASTTVISGRLPSGVAVQSRLFPKIRSWLALGAPLELLSPLSVVRVVYAVLSVSWAAEAAAFDWSRAGLAVVLTAAAGAAGTWLAIFHLSRLGARGCGALLGAATALDLLVVAFSPSAALGLASIGLLLVPSVTVAFFFSGRAVARHLAFTSLGMLASTARITPVATAVAVTLTWSLSILATSLLLQVVMIAMGRNGTTDPETGLPNGIGLSRGLRSHHDAPWLTVVALDVAGVDDARQALGYHVGAELLRRAVEDLGQVLAADALIARVDGDQLVVVQTHHRPPRAGADEKLARDLATAIQAGRYVIDQVEVSLRAHAGVISAGTDRPVATELVRRAQLAARQACAAGVTCLAWDGSVGTFTAEDLALLADLRLAVERGELRLAYQPQLSTGDGRVVSVEALLRWDSPVHGPVPPGRFIVLAERTGLIERLTRWVLGEALDAQARWRAAGVDCPVSVNLSPRILGLPDLAATIIAALHTRRLPAQSLTVEVTETAAVALLDAIQLLRPLHERGVRVSIDDFGTGYTSLAAIPHLPLDELKVDMGFVKRSIHSAADQAIVRMVRDLAHRLRLTSVAEGVETDEIRSLMSEIGFDLLQGFSIAKPLGEADLLAFLRGARVAAAPPVWEAGVAMSS